MTNPTTLLALAERCKQAAGPDRVLDAEIMCALLGHMIHKDSDPAKGHFAFWIGEPENSVCMNCSGWARITESLDEAVTLVPEGWEWEIYSDGGALLFVVPRHIDETQRNATCRSAATPALALCAAALRARAAEYE